jgi:methyltransferase-like protein/SAM-dependent methyltransferase
MDMYELVPYGSRSFPEAHPDRLAAVARLFGRQAPDPRQARILELGCGSGMHLVPIAHRLPGAVCVGIDRSASSIVAARTLASRVGVHNLALIEADLAEADTWLSRSDLPEAYDYIVAHGVYSWVESEVREALMARCARWLAPDGVVYVSYNAKPGWSMRGAIAEMMRFHASGFSQPQRQVAQSRALLHFLSEVVPGSDPYGAWLRREERLVASQPDDWLFHDLLSADNSPVYLHEFVSHATRHGLVYLGDSDVPSMLPDRLPAEVRKTLASLGSDQLRAEQYLDFVLCRSFRRSLLVHPGPIDRELTASRLIGTFVRGTAELLPQESEGGAELFRTRAGDTISTDVPLLRAALLVLFERRPEPVAFEELVQAAMERAGESHDLEKARELVGRNLLLCFSRGALELYPRPIPMVSQVSLRPVACPLVRALCGSGSGMGGQYVPNLLQEMIPVDTLDRIVLTRLDGSRTKESLVDELCSAVQSGALEAPGLSSSVEGAVPDVLSFVQDWVPRRLDQFGRSGLLVG